MPTELSRARWLGARRCSCRSKICSGARVYGKIVDPFGHEWGINQQLKEQSEEETQAAAVEFFAKRN
jgi:hypothetical protein